MATNETAQALRRRKTLFFQFGQKHIDYIKACETSLFNIAEGAVRAGKTIDNVYAFAHELKTTPDKIHLASGSTAANAKLNIGDANGYGLEHIFRGQCRWGKYKGNECLIIKGPDTRNRTRVVIFAGASLANSFKKIRGNSYGMWIATEVNLHHDSFIKEAFDRSLAARRRKVFWDLNPDHPKAPIYVNYIEKYRGKAAAGTLVGGCNYQHFTIFDNVTVTKRRLEEIVSQYDKSSIWYLRDILGKRCVAEGLIYKKFADMVATHRERHLVTVEEIRGLIKDGKINNITVAADFGSAGSGHAFVCTAKTVDYGNLYALCSEWHDAHGLDPTQLGNLFTAFCMKVLKLFGYISEAYGDSADQILINGLNTALIAAGFGNITVENAYKDRINERISATATVLAQGRFYYTELCDSLLDAMSTCIWDAKQQAANVRLDDGTSDIDTMDAFEYSWSHDMREYVEVAMPAEEAG